MIAERRPEKLTSIRLTPVGKAKLAKLLAKKQLLEEQIDLFLNAYLAAHGIEEGTVEEIDVENGILIVREGKEDDRPAHHSPDAEGA